MLLAVACAAQADSNPFSFFLQEKARQAKLTAEGETVRNQLQFHGDGITDGQETQILNWVDQAGQAHAHEIYENALYIQQKVEDNYSGRWAVEILTNDPGWGRATHTDNEQWVIIFGYGSDEWDYIIWKPAC